VTSPFGLSFLGIGFAAVAAALIACFAGSRLAAVVVRHDHRLTPIRHQRTVRTGMPPAWLLDGRWWTVPVGFAVARMVGPGCPLWLTTSIAVGAGALDAVCRGRIILVVALPGAVALALLLAKGTACTTGLGLVGYAVVPVVAWAVHRNISRTVVASTPGPTQRWRPELTAAIGILVVEAMIVPLQLGMGLRAAPPSMLWMSTVIAVAVVVAVWAGRRGQAVAGLAISSVIANAGLMVAPVVCAGQPASVLAAVGGVLAGFTLASLAMARRPSLA